MRDNSSTLDRTNSHKELEATAKKIADLEQQERELKAQTKEKREEIKFEYERAEKAGFRKGLLKTVISELRTIDEDGPEQVQMELEGDFKNELELDTYRDALGIPTMRDARKKVDLGRETTAQAAPAKRPSSRSEGAS